MCSGLFELGEYAALAAHRGSAGMSATALLEPGSGLTLVLLILGLEGPLFVALTYALEQARAQRAVGRRRRVLKAMRSWFLALAHRISAGVGARLPDRELQLPVRGVMGQPSTKAPQKTAGFEVSSSASASLEPDDVAAERQRVAQLGPTGDGAAIVMRALGKTYAAQDGQPPKVHGPFIP